MFADETLLNGLDRDTKEGIEVLIQRANKELNNEYVPMEVSINDLPFDTQNILTELEMNAYNLCEALNIDEYINKGKILPIFSYNQTGDFRVTASKFCILAHDIRDEIMFTRNPDPSLSVQALRLYENAELVLSDAKETALLMGGLKLDELLTESMKVLAETEKNIEYFGSVASPFLYEGEQKDAILFYLKDDNDFLYAFEDKDKNLVFMNEQKERFYPEKCEEIEFYR